MNARREPAEEEGRHVRTLTAQLSVEDTGDAFFLLSEGEGHDLTLSLEPEVAFQLAEFILSRRRLRADAFPSGGNFS